MRFSHLLAVIVTVIALFTPQIVQATTYSYWYPYTDTRGTTIVNCRWRVMADVQYPYNWYNYYPSSASSANVPHLTYNGVFLEALSTLGLGTSYMSLVSDMRRWDSRYNEWVYFPDVILSGYYPPYEGPMYYSRTFKNPYNGYPDYDVIGLTPANEWNHCDGLMQATNLELGYLSISITERQFYSVHY